MIRGIVIKGHGVASGTGRDPRYPKGTLKQQAPFFKDGGLDIDRFHPGTINLDISPYEFVIGCPKYFFSQINWSPFIPPENFYFFDLLAYHQDQEYKGLIYMPDPETKTDHQQAAHIIELLLPKMPGLNYGKHLKIAVPEDQLKFSKTV